VAKENQAPDLVITITLPESSVAPHTGRIVVQRGELGTVAQFEYLGIDEIFEAIQHQAGRLIAVEENPPPKDVVAPKGKDSAKLLAGKDDKPAAAQPELSTEPPAAAEADETETVDEPEPAEESAE
jgi:hypothetical protein